MRDISMLSNKDKAFMIVNRFFFSTTTSTYIILNMDVLKEGISEDIHAAQRASDHITSRFVDLSPYRIPLIARKPCDTKELYVESLKTMYNEYTQWVASVEPSDAIKKEYLQFVVGDLIPWKSTAFIIGSIIFAMDNGIPYIQTNASPLLGVLNTFIDLGIEDTKITLMGLSQLAHLIGSEYIVDQQVTPMNIFVEYAAVVKGVDFDMATKAATDFTNDTRAIENLKYIKTQLNRPHPGNMIDPGYSLLNNYRGVIITSHSDIFDKFNGDEKRHLIMDVSMIDDDTIRSFIGMDFTAEFGLTEEMIGYLRDNDSDIIQLKYPNNGSKYVLLRNHTMYLLFRDPVDVASIYGISLSENPDNSRSCIKIDIPKNRKLELLFGGFDI